MSVSRERSTRRAREDGDRHRLPAGYVTLKGGFAREHREAIVAIVRGCEAREKTGDALRRIMAIEDVAAGILVTTTDAYFARGIAVTLRAAFGGTMRARFAGDENVLRAVWERAA